MEENRPVGSERRRLVKKGPHLWTAGTVSDLQSGREQQLKVAKNTAFTVTNEKRERKEFDQKIGT